MGAADAPSTLTVYQAEGPQGAEHRQRVSPLQSSRTVRSATRTSRRGSSRFWYNTRTHDGRNTLCGDAGLHRSKCDIARRQRSYCRSHRRAGCSGACGYPPWISRRPRRYLPRRGPARRPRGRHRRASSPYPARWRRCPVRPPGRRRSELPFLRLSSPTTRDLLSLQHPNASAYRTITIFM